MMLCLHGGMEIRLNLTTEPGNLRRSERLTRNPQRQVQRRPGDDRDTVDRQLLEPRKMRVMHAQHREDANLRPGSERLRDLLRLPPQRTQNPIQRPPAIPQPTVKPDTDRASVQLGVDHENPSRPDHQMVDISRRARHREIMERNKPVSLQPSKNPSRPPLPP